MSTTLFDTVAVYAAQPRDLLIMEDLPVRVTDDGYTVVDERDGRIVHCATGCGTSRLLRFNWSISCSANTRIRGVRVKFCEFLTLTPGVWRDFWDSRGSE